MSDETKQEVCAADSVVDVSRRNWLIATSVTGGLGTIAAAMPFACSLAPSERAKAGGAPVEVDIATLKPGQMITTAWRGLPIWILRRTPDEIASIKKTESQVADPNSQVSANFPMPSYCQNKLRARKGHDDILVLVGLCTHLGCIPIGPYLANANPVLGADFGFVCPCHGSTFDMAGRVFRDKPAPKNLDVPRYMFLSETKIVIGKDEQGEA